tara:strand:+ start:2448 stop:3218 length:771 start_codon:yes stop_codon:yes gene_type:complete
MSNLENNMLFPVKEVPAILQDTHLSTEHKFIVREDTEQVLSCMSNEYKLVTNQEVFEKSSEVIKEFEGTLTETKIFGNGARARWRYRFPQTIKVGEDDMHPEIIMGNSYDGTSQVYMMMGAYRLICSNGMIIGVTFGKFNNRHSVYNPNVKQLDTVLPDMIRTAITAIENDLPELQNIKLNPSDVSKIVELFPEQSIENLVQYLLTNKPDTYWDLLNACTWMSTHVLNRKTEATHKLEQNVYKMIKSMSDKQVAIT